ncbi:MAG: hypothetical protein AAFV33_03915 [Chloroflexota bacterium]
MDPRELEYHLHDRRKDYQQAAVAHRLAKRAQHHVQPTGADMWIWVVAVAGWGVLFAGVLTAGLVWLIL